MRIIVTAKPGSGKDHVEWSDEMHCTVWTRAKPVDGQANIRIIELVAESLKRPKTTLKLVAGKTGKTKTLELA